MDVTKAIEWAAARKQGALITIRRDGRPQSSDIVYAVIDGAFVISITDDRAKTHNMRRDPRVVLHLSDPGSWSYVSFDGVIDLSPAAASVDDGTVDALVAYYEVTNGQPHPDWAEYRQAMVDQRRLTATLAPTSAVGQIH